MAFADGSAIEGRVFAFREFTMPRADEVRKIADLAFGDAVEITSLIELIRRQNADGINAEMNKAGAGRAAMVLRNAMIARLVTLVARAYAPAKKGDLHVRVAVDIFRDNTTRQMFTSVAGGKEKVADFEKRWLRCHGDHRKPAIKEFRDKFTAHLGEPSNSDPATYKDLFDFGAATAELMESLALATGAIVAPIKSDPDVTECAAKFWQPWKKAETGRLA